MIAVRDEQRKFIKYNHLVANLLVFHNLVTMTRAIHRIERDGHQMHHSKNSEHNWYT
jgi:hypothetical protein